MEKRRAPRRWTAGRLASVCGLVTVLAVHGALAWISHFPQPRRFFGDETILYWPGATRLAAGLAWQGDPLWPPLQPRFLAAVLFISDGSLLVVQVVQTIMLMAAAFLLCDLTRRLSGSPVAGVVAGWLLLVYPPLAAFVHYLWPEVLHLLLLLSAWWIFVARSRRPAWLFAGGVILGVALLTKSLLGPFLPVLLLPLALAGSLGERVSRLALVALGIVVAVAPTVYSNHQRATGVFISDSLAFNLWVGLNDRSRVGFADGIVGPEWHVYRQSAPSLPERDDILYVKIRQLVAERGIWPLLRAQLGRQYFRLFDKDSYLTVQLPGGAIAGADRGGYQNPPWLLASGLRVTSYALYAAVLVAALMGMAVCPHKGRPWLLVGLAFLAYNLAIFLLLHVKSRYRIQLLPFFFFYTGCAVAWCFERSAVDLEKQGLWKVKLAGWVWPAAVLLLFLAFGRGLLE